MRENNGGLVKNRDLAVLSYVTESRAKGKEGKVGTCCRFVEGEGLSQCLLSPLWRKAR